MKIWTCGSSPRSGSGNAWTPIKNVNGANRLSNFWIFFGATQMISCRARLVTMDETWLYYYDPDTKQQSMEWRHSGSPRPAPKNSECKNPLEKFSPRFFLESRRHPPHWLSSKGPNYQRGVLLISAGAIAGHFEGKTPEEWEMFQTNVVEKIRTDILCSVLCFRKSCRVMYKNTVERVTTEVTIWRMRIAGSLRLQTHTHTHTICSTYCFPTATMVARTRPHVTLYVHRVCYLSSS